MNKVTKLRKNARRPARTNAGRRDTGFLRFSQDDKATFLASRARFKRAMTTNDNDTTGLDLMTNVDYYNEHGCLPENCGMGLKGA